MKKIIFIMLTLVILTSFYTRAFSAPLLDMRNKIFSESKELKSLLLNTKDIILLSSIWDSSILTTSQLDAYFSMLGIFNTIKNENLTEISIDYLIDWLNVIKKTNELNIKSLGDISKAFEPQTKIHMQRLNDYFIELNNQIDNELRKLSLLKKSLKPTRRR